MQKNQIILGDSYKLIKTIEDKTVDLIYTDIPYLIKNNKVNRNAKSAINIRKNKQSLELEELQIADGIDYSILDEFCRIMKKIYIYIWCSKEQILDLMKYFVDNKKCNFNLLCWCKTNAIPAVNNSWLPNIEYCLVFKEPLAPRYNDGYELKSKYYVSQINKKDKELFDHPTIKPLELVKQHILHSSNKGDLIFDPFAGSGTTLVAAKELDRDFIGFEISEKYYNIAKNRLLGITNKEAKNYGTKTLFDD